MSSPKIEEGAMLAIKITDNIDILKNTIESLGLKNIWLANYNTTDQIVLSGKKKEILILNEILKNASILLNVSAAFHCRLMENAVPPLEKMINSVVFKNAQIPIVSNYTAKEAVNADEIKYNLIQQTTNTVLWKNSLDYLFENNVEIIVECGPGTTLCSFARKTNNSKGKYININKYDSLKKLDTIFI